MTGRAKPEAPVDADLGLWIRTNASIVDDARVWELRERLNVQPDLFASQRNVTGNVTSLATVVGLVTMLELRVAQHQMDGNLSQRPLAQLENWAGWEGAPGVFAKAYLELMCGSDGVITDWGLRHDKLIEAREQGRKRVRAHRARQKGRNVTPDVTLSDGENEPRGVTGNVTGNGKKPPVTLPTPLGNALYVNVNVDEQRTTPPPPRAREESEGDSEWWSQIGVKLGTYRPLGLWVRMFEHPGNVVDDARRLLLVRLSQKAGPEGYGAALARCNEAITEGLMEGGVRVVLTAAELEEALTQFLADGRVWNLRLLTRYLGGVREKARAIRGSGPLSGQAEKGAAAKETAAAVFDALAGRLPATVPTTEG